MKNIDDTYDYNCSDDDDDDSNCENYIKKISNENIYQLGHTNTKHDSYNNNLCEKLLNTTKEDFITIHKVSSSQAMPRPSSGDGQTISGLFSMRPSEPISVNGAQGSWQLIVVAGEDIAG